VRGTSPKDHKIPIPQGFPVDRLNIITQLMSKMKIGTWNNEVWKKWCSFPVIYVTLDTGNEILKNSGKTIMELKSEIDKNQKPNPFSIGKTAKIKTTVSHGIQKTMNVIGLIEGNHPSLKDEVIIIGAHYDHLGMSRDSSEIYYGAIGYCCSS